MSTLRPLSQAFWRTRKKRQVQNLSPRLLILQPPPWPLPPPPSACTVNPLPPTRVLHTGLPHSRWHCPRFALTWTASPSAPKYASLPSEPAPRADCVPDPGRGPQQPWSGAGEGVGGHSLMGTLQHREGVIGPISRPALRGSRQILSPAQGGQPAPLTLL